MYETIESYLDYRERSKRGLVLSYQQLVELKQTRTENSLRSESSLPKMNSKWLHFNKRTISITAASLPHPSHLDRQDHATPSCQSEPKLCPARITLASIPWRRCDEYSTSASKRMTRKIQDSLHTSRNGRGTNLEVIRSLAWRDLLASTTDQYHPFQSFSCRLKRTCR